MMAKIIFLGYGGVNNIYIQPQYGKLQEKQLQFNEPYQVQMTAGNDPWLGLPLGC